jgi:GGDEF domain-containing protein
MRPVLERVAMAREFWRSAVEPLDLPWPTSYHPDRDVVALDGWAYADDDRAPRLLASTGRAGSASGHARGRTPRPHSGATTYRAGAPRRRRRGHRPALDARGRTRAVLVGLDRSTRDDRVSLPAPARRALVQGLELLSLSLDTALRIERAEALSVTDDLTQLYNSRFLSQVLRRETKRSTRSRRPLSLLFLDLDGSRTQARTGPSAAARSPGRRPAASRHGNRHRRAVRRRRVSPSCCPIPMRWGPASWPNGSAIASPGTFLESEGAVRLSISIGIGVLPTNATTAEVLIQAADEAMSG